ncbi:MAG: AhpC/TSA family protein [Geminicoccaceae bacterium]|nr:AhpC/TSA family protein [Geminicoccaceae bacterium]
MIVEGHRGDALERILAMVKDRSAAAGVAPVIVTISADLDRIAAAGLPFEVLVDPDGEAVDDLPMRHRLEQQMEAIVRLWQPINVIAFVTPTRARLKHLLEEALRAGRVRPPPGGA